MRNHALHRDLWVVLTLLVLSLLFFWPVTLGGKTMLPADNVFAWEPWRSYAAEARVGVPHNGLLSDLYLENYVWKRFITQSLKDRQIPLWNPYILAGVPFLAAGQHSAMYPLSILFYLLSLPAAYGWFAALHVFLAGAFTYALARNLRIGRVGSTLAALSFMFGGFMIIRNVFPMIIAAAVWLPLVLTAIERIVCRAGRGESQMIGYIPEMLLGTLSLGMVFLAGHPEMYYYVALISAAFALWRLVGLKRAHSTWSHSIRAMGLMIFMALLGVGLGSAQWLPLLHLVKQSFRQGGASFREVLGWAYPPRRLISLFVPDFFGNPTAHSYLDLFSGEIKAVTVNALGKPIDTIYWGMKNYVEGASYIGILPSLLAVIAVLRGRGRHLIFWAALAILSLLFVFGSPLYYLIYRLPGLSQVHSPFRWIYAYSLCMALLAGMGADALSDVAGRALDGTSWRRLWATWAQRALPIAALTGGLLTLAILALSLLLKEQFATLAEQAMQHLAKAPEAFADGRMFYSYEFRNLLIFGLALSGSGLVLVLRRRLKRPAVWGAMAALVVVLELFAIGRPFFPAVDPGLVAYRTPAIDFLQSDPELFRVTSYVHGSEKTLNANTAMFYDIADIRGYDSIIPRQYAETMGIIQKQSELQYNRIAPIFDSHPQALAAPLLDMLNVKYVVTSKSRTIDQPGYSLAYDEEIRIYRNEEALPRAFLVARAASIPDSSERREALSTFAPDELVILEETFEHQLVDTVPADFSHLVEAIDYSPNEVSITVKTSIPSFLVLGDSYFDGWLAFIRPTDALEPSLAEQTTHIYRANGNFRAVEVPAGEHVVRFKYSPNEVKFGLYMSFLSGIVVLLGLILWTWLRFYREADGDMTVHRVTKNTVAPIGLNLVNKVIDMAFAMLMLRILGPEDAGRYYLAVVVIGWFDILINFGLNTLLTREVAKDKSHANRYLSNTIILRAGLWVLSVPLLGFFFGLRFVTKPLEPSTILAIALFGLGLLPSNISASFAAVFNAHERMELPAGVTTITTLLKVTLGTFALFAQTGFVGLAAVSIVVNTITMIVLYLLLRKSLLHPHLEFDLTFQKRMIRDSYPLMINLLLATLFFKVAVLLLEWLQDPRVVGWYSTAYKYIDAVQLVPAYFTMAIFPLMSRFAATAMDSLIKAYMLALKLLLIVAVPLSLFAWALSTDLIVVLGGSQYLPYSAQILKVMIWYMPLGFINSVTQYVLIALDQQRFLTRAFGIGLAFSVCANLLLISRYGYMASAYVAIASELVLLIPFYLGIRRHLTRIPWVTLLGKQALCALPMILLFTLLSPRYVLLSLVVGLASYIPGIALLRVFDAEEREALQRVLPWRSVAGKLVSLANRPVDSIPGQE